ncbi:MAG: chemotaxis protein CheW [Gammaproteobacteria bacterium]|nr:chemotaxis protein CheW [Gammaproteobacteria bacterium]
MAGEAKQVRGLLIPLQAIRLILPDSMIVQIVTGAEISPISNAPTWLQGTAVWQKRIIPAISFEVAANQQYRPIENPRLLVLKSINNIDKMPFYAITLAGIPRPARVSGENMAAVENAASSSPVILNEVLIDGEPTTIPNLDALEEMLMSQYGLFAEEAPAA